MRKTVFKLSEGYVSNSRVKIYLSGAITSDIKKGRNWKGKFYLFEDFVKMFYPHADVFNPAREKEGYSMMPDGPVEDLRAWQYRKVMTRDLTALMECDFIALLPDWKKSKGARCEKEVAECLGIKKLYLSPKTIRF